MRKYQWTVGRLREMFPPNPALLGLNVNAGEEIRIRLRPAHNEHAFLPFDDLLGTMLHELVHNRGLLSMGGCGWVWLIHPLSLPVSLCLSLALLLPLTPCLLPPWTCHGTGHAAHDRHFYALLDTITKDCDDAMARGYVVEVAGYIGHGHRLGDGGASAGASGRTTTTSSTQELRRIRLQATEKRLLHQQRMLPYGGRRLGGIGGGLGGGGLGGAGGLEAVCEARELAVMAAMRRAEDAKWCGSGGGGGAPTSTATTATTATTNTATVEDGDEDDRSIVTIEYEDGSDGDDQDDRHHRGEPVSLLHDVDRTDEEKEEEADLVVDLSTSDDATGTTTATVAHPMVPPSAPFSEDDHRKDDHKDDHQKDDHSKDDDSASGWTCHRCTFANRPVCLSCEVCLAVRVFVTAAPSVTATATANAATISSSSATLRDDDDSGGGGGTMLLAWSCQRCTFLNQPCDRACAVCSAPRPPSTTAPCAGRERERAPPPPSWFCPRPCPCPRPCTHTHVHKHTHTPCTFYCYYYKQIELGFTSVRCLLLALHCVALRCIIVPHPII